jgi:antitoxin HigA-1
MSIPIEDVMAGRVDFGDVAGSGRLPPLHPGEVLREEFLEPLRMSAYALAKALHVPVNRVTAILAGERAISADTALRLAGSSGPPPSSGSICRAPTTSTWRDPSAALTSQPKSRSGCPPSDGFPGAGQALDRPFLLTPTAHGN